MEPAQTLMDGEASSDLANVGSGVRAIGQEIRQKSSHRQQPLTNRYPRRNDRHSCTLRRRRGRPGRQEPSGCRDILYPGEVGNDIIRPGGPEHFGRSCEILRAPAAPGAAMDEDERVCRVGCLICLIPRGRRVRLSENRHLCALKLSRIEDDRKGAASVPSVNLKGPEMAEETAPPFVPFVPLARRRWWRRLSPAVRSFVRVAVGAHSRPAPDG
jgi:hypothetical protein